MIKGYLKDLKALTMIGIVLFFVGFMFSSLFLLALGFITAGNSFALFCLISNDYEQRKGL